MKYPRSFISKTENDYTGISFGLKKIKSLAHEKNLCNCITARSLLVDKDERTGQKR